jgi:hypothetical protein
VAAANVQAVFPDAPWRAGIYESFYLRAVAPERPLGVWIRYTAHKHPSQPAQGSLWCTVFDGVDAPPFMHKLTTEALSVPDGGWIAVGDSRLGPEGAEGACGEARWSLRFASREPALRHLALRHLPHALLYRAPLPRTKLSSPLPAARFEGTLELPAPALASRSGTPAAAESLASPPRSSRAIELDGWRGMVGHNWGAQHAERWVWLHGVGFEEDPEAWIDVAVGRVRVAGHTTPWVANGELRIDGERHRLGGLGARGLLVAERPERCVLSLPGPDGLVAEAHVRAPRAALAGWRYADPDGGRSSHPDSRPSHPDSGRSSHPDGARPSHPDSGRSSHPDGARPSAGGWRGGGTSEGHWHEVSNCSIAALTLTVRRRGRASRTLRTAHGAAYELGMRERNHGVPIAPFEDG